MASYCVTLPESTPCLLWQTGHSTTTLTLQPFAKGTLYINQVIWQVNLPISQDTHRSLSHLFSDSCKWRRCRRLRMGEAGTVLMYIDSALRLTSPRSNYSIISFRLPFASYCLLLLRFVMSISQGIPENILILQIIRSSPRGF